jgi:hypothetical protein
MTVTGRDRTDQEIVQETLILASRADIWFVENRPDYAERLSELLAGENPNGAGAALSRLVEARDTAIQERDDAQTLNARLAEDCKTAVTNWREAEADLGPALARLERVEAALRERAEAWEQNAEDAEFAGNSYRGSDGEAAATLFRQAARSRNVARVLREVLAAALSDALEHVTLGAAGTVDE